MQTINEKHPHLVTGLVSLFACLSSTPPSVLPCASIMRVNQPAMLGEEKAEKRRQPPAISPSSCPAEWVHIETPHTRGETMRTDELKPPMVASQSHLSAHASYVDSTGTYRHALARRRGGPRAHTLSIMPTIAATTTKVASARNKRLVHGSRGADRERRGREVIAEKERRISPIGIIFRTPPHRGPRLI